MITLQRKIAYTGSRATAPVKSVSVVFDLPVYEYASTGADGKVVTRRASEYTQTISIEHSLSSTTYQALPGDDFITGRDNQSAAWAKEFSLNSLQSGNIADLVVTVVVRYLVDGSQELGRQSVELLCLPKLEVQPARKEEAGRSGVARPSFLAINRQAFDILRKQLAGASLNFSDGTVLGAISVLTVFDDDTPTIPDVASVDLKGWLDSQEGRTTTADTNKVLKFIKAASALLYDFPLAIPEIQTVTIAGKLTVVTQDANPVSEKDFAAFTIIAECRYQGEAQSRSLPSPPFQFPGNVKITAGSATFQLTDGPPLYRNGLQGPVTLRVNSAGVPNIWSKEFKPDDPGLSNVDIQVSRQNQIQLTAPPKDTLPEAVKKLRGRVLTLNKECVLTELLVLVQAKKSADAPWRVVSAATTDGLGNFAMPYPYGKYAQAQALVSLAPKEPADIPIVTGNDNESLSDDFLYLLLSNPDCPAPTTKEECDCSSADKPNRLPDHSDLIGSDVYSQDIGGTCVNLSKPNRTISEFTYQAIVRVSDPSVSNYTLTKVETRLEAIDVSLLAYLTGGSVALSETESRALATATSTYFPPVAVNYVGAVKAAATHVETIKAALAAGAPPITLTVLADVQTHVDTVLAVLEASKTLDPDTQIPGPGPADRQSVLDAANSLKTVIAQAIDSVGTAARYELTGGAVTRDRRPVALDNPVAWQDAPETPPAKPLAGDGLVGFVNTRFGRAGAIRIPFAAPSQKVPAGDPSATFSQAVTVATGHILHYKSEFKADGYSLGDLIYSLPLAPGQKKEIVVFDASHTLVGAETQSLTQNERLAMGLIDERDITNQLAGRLSESLRGSSTANTSGISAGFGTGGQGSGSSGAYGGSGSAVIGVAGGVANANSTASQDSSRDVSQFFGEKLRQSIMQNAEGYRQLNASVVSTVQEGQRYGVTSEVVANHNHCHALTMMYFEVLRHYAIFQKLSAVEECVFVPLLLTHFSTDNVAKWRDVLAPALLPMPSDTYLQSAGTLDTRQHPLLKAFDADQRIKTHYANVDFPVGSYDDERIRFIKGTMRIRVELPRPQTRFDRIMSLPVTTKTITTKEIDPEATARAALEFPKKMAEYATKTAVTAGLNNLFGDRPPDPPGIQYTTTQKEILVREAIFDTFMKLDANYENVPPAQCIRVTNFKPPTKIAVPPFGELTVSPTPKEFFAENVEDQTQWQAYADLLGYKDVLTMLNAHFRGNLIAEWDSIFYNQIAPLAFEKILESLSLDQFKVDFAGEAKYRGGERVLRVNLAGTASKKRNQLPDVLKLKVTNSALQDLSEFVTVIVVDMTINYSTAHYNGVLFSGSLNDDLLDANGTDIFIPENAEEKRNPRREDRYLAARLIEHLNSNLEHYNKVLWYNLDPDRRYMLLDGFSIQVYDDDGTPIPADLGGSRSLASVVKNEVIAVAGNSLVLPVAPGYRVSGSFIHVKRDGSKEPVSLFDHYKPLTPIEPYRVSVPSKGVFAEAVQGACNACEKIETERLQDWNRFPNTDEPTSISPIVTPTPVVTDWRAAFKDFATPIVNIQNAPIAPAPGAGLAGLSDLLAKSGVFKDITGLDANQQNVIRTYLSNQENAKAFAEMAKEMAMQQHNTQNTGKIMDSLKSAKDGGALNQEDYSKLVKDHLQQQIDGGETKKAELEKEKQQTTPSLTKAAVDAANHGKDVKAQKTDSEGNTESLDITEPRNDTAVPTSTAPQTILVGDVSEAPLWSDLIAFTVSPALLAAVTARDLEVQKIDDGYGDVNLDWFQVDITKLPNRPGTTTPFDDVGLFEYIRKNFPEFLLPYPRTGKPLSLETYEASDTVLWASAAPLGSVLLFTIDPNPLPKLPGLVSPLAASTVPELGLVLCSEYVTQANEDHHWNFTTLKGPNPIGYHPVSGTRQFGLGRKKQNWVFYVRAADRPTTFFEYGGSPLVFSGADEYWDYLQTKLIDFIVNNNGTAERGLVSSKRYDWRRTRELLFGMKPEMA